MKVSPEIIPAESAARSAWGQSAEALLSAEPTPHHRGEATPPIPLGKLRLSAGNVAHHHTKLSHRSHASTTKDGGVFLCEDDMRKLRRIMNHIRISYRTVTQLRKVQAKIPLYCWAMFVLAMIGVVLQFAELQVAFVDTGVPLHNDPYTTEIIKACVTLTTIPLVFLVFFYYKLVAKLEAIEWHNPHLTLWRNKRILYRCIIELIVNFYHVPPMLGLATGDFFNDKMGVFMIFRFYHIARIVRNHTRVWRERQNVLDFSHYKLGQSFINNMDFDWSLAVRALFYERPVSFVVGGCMTLYCILSYCVYITEREFQSEFNWPPNVFYFTLITMATVGYGDMTAKTQWGRILACMSAVIGILIFSTFVAVISARLVLEPHQLYVTEWSLVSKLRDEQRRRAAMLIQYHWRRVIDRKKGKNEPTPREKEKEHSLVRALLQTRRQVVAAQGRMYPPDVAQFLALKERLDSAGLNKDTLSDLAGRVEKLEGKLEDLAGTLSRDTFEQAFERQKTVLRGMASQLEDVVDRVMARAEKVERAAAVEAKMDAILQAINQKGGVSPRGSAPNLAALLQGMGGMGMGILGGGVAPMIMANKQQQSSLAALANVPNGRRNTIDATPAMQSSSTSVAGGKPLNKSAIVFTSASRLPDATGPSLVDEQSAPGPGRPPSAALNTNTTPPSTLSDSPPGGAMAGVPWNGPGLTTSGGSTGTAATVLNGYPGLTGAALNGYGSLGGGALPAVNVVTASLPRQADHAAILRDPDQPSQMPPPGGFFVKSSASLSGEFTS